MDRAAVILLLATGPYVEPLRQQECPGEPLYDTAVVVADTAHMAGMSWSQMGDWPHVAVDITQRIWKALPNLDEDSPQKIAKAALKRERRRQARLARGAQ